MTKENATNAAPVHGIVIWRYDRVTGIGHGFEDGHSTSKCGRMTDEMGDRIERRHCYLCAECRDSDACRICDGNKTLYNMPDDCDVVCWLCKGSGLRVDEAR